MKLFKFYKDNPSNMKTYQFPISIQKEGILGFYYDKWGMVEEWRLFEFKELDAENWPDEDLVDGHDVPDKKQLINVVFATL